MGICTKRSCTLALATACLQDLTPNQLIIIGPENFPTWGRAIFALWQISGLCQALNDILDSMSSKGIAIPVWVKSSRPGGGWYLSELLQRLQNWQNCFIGSRIDILYSLLLLQMLAMCFWNQFLPYNRLAQNLGYRACSSSLVWVFMGLAIRPSAVCRQSDA